MFVTNWISTTKIQKISEITNFFRHYFLSRTEVILWKLELFIVKPCFASNLRLETSVNPNLMYIVCFHNFHRGTTPNNMYHSETSFFI